ncbi:hypothetical protein V6N13_041437 [Hibiscus sabdariffa]
MERLDGFKLYGYILSVTIAKYNVRTSYWKKEEDGSSRSMAEVQEVEGDVIKQEKKMGFTVNETYVMEGNKSCTKNCRRVRGHVDNEMLWMLGKCLVGTMTCSTEVVKERLNNWGLGDTLVKGLGGQQFLLRIEEGDIMKLLEDKKWSLLEEIFSNVEYWFESFRVPDRMIWVEIRGIPIHCWNYDTFMRIAETWGRLVELGENSGKAKSHNIDLNERVELKKANSLEREGAADSSSTIGPGPCIPVSPNGCTIIGEENNEILNEVETSTKEDAESINGEKNFELPEMCNRHKASVKKANWWVNNWTYPNLELCKIPVKGAKGIRNRDSYAKFPGCCRDMVLFAKFVDGRLEKW